MHIERVCLHTFIRDYLTPQSTVLDCGSNRGHFSKWISDNVGCRVHGFEPDPRFYEILPSLSGCSFHQLAVSNKPGRMRLNLGTTSCSSLHYQEACDGDVVEVETTTLPTFCDAHEVESIDLLKLDIEGEEVPILLSLDADFLRSRITQITVEFHDHKDAGAVPKIHEIGERLSALGFFWLPMTHFTFGDVLFVNRAKSGIRKRDELQLKYHRYSRGALRYLERTLVAPVRSAMERTA